MKATQEQIPYMGCGCGTCEPKECTDCIQSKSACSDCVEGSEYKAPDINAEYEAMMLERRN